MLITFTLWSKSLVYRSENISPTTTTTVLLKKLPTKHSKSYLEQLTELRPTLEPPPWAMGGRKTPHVYGPGIVTALGAFQLEWLPLLRNDQAFFKHLAF